MSDAGATLVVVCVFAAFFFAFVLLLLRARRRRVQEFSETREEEESSKLLALEQQLDSPSLAEQVASDLDLKAANEAAGEDTALKAGLAKTQSSLWGRFSQILAKQTVLDTEVLVQLEEALLLADVGVSLTSALIDRLREQIKRKEVTEAGQVRQSLRKALTAVLAEADDSRDIFALNNAPSPYVIMFVGVNGVGKTTTIGKLAAQFTARGHAPVLAAGDTFRAAATAQLKIWAERTNSTLIQGETNADPASVVYNAIAHAKQQGVKVVLADTAGRLHTKSELMDEIKKVRKAASKAREGAPDEIWLVVDATTGQNALLQAREFHQAMGLTGIILTKLDGTAKGGVVLAIADALKIPVRFVGVGEKVEDLRPFSAAAFVSALFSPLP